MSSRGSSRSLDTRARIDAVSVSSSARTVAGKDRMKGRAPSTAPFLRGFARRFFAIVCFRLSFVGHEGATSVTLSRSRLEANERDTAAEMYE